MGLARSARRERIKRAYRTFCAEWRELSVEQKQGRRRPTLKEFEKLAMAHHARMVAQAAEERQKQEEIDAQEFKPEDLEWA